MKTPAKLLSLLLALLLLSACAPAEPAPALPTTTAAPTAAPAAPAQKTSGIGFFFDTVVQITLYGADETLMEDIWALCKRYENLLSRTIPESDVGRINASNGQTVTVDPDTWAILKEAKAISAQTDGAFSVTIAPLSTMWDFTNPPYRMPTDDARIAALPLVDDSAILLGEGCTVTLPAGMQVDLGGIAKGYIADRVAELVRGRSAAAIIALGGNVYVTGTKPDGSLNTVGIRDPKSQISETLCVLFLRETSVVTSGTYERGFAGPDGLWYHHILDPKTGTSARSDLVSATFVTPSSMLADALATACIVRGSQWALDFAEENGYDALFITSDGETLATPGFMEKYNYTLYADLFK